MGKLDSKLYAEQVPSGRWIVYAAEHNGDAPLYILDADLNLLWPEPVKTEGN